VYERLDWRDIVLSRATRGACGVNQTAYSYLPSEGASLHLILKEDERLCKHFYHLFLDFRQVLFE
jgi:hypothetical protein